MYNFTGGKTPYPGATNREVIDFVDKGHRLNRPLKCSHDVYSLMMSCWLENSASRPNFDFIFEKLESLIDNININIKAVEDYHSQVNFRYTSNWCTKNFMLCFKSFN